MPLFHDLPVRITGLVRHADDFTFPKLKEELAVKIRSENLPKIRGLLQDPRVGFDSDGDIKISAGQGTVYVMQSSVFFITQVEKIALIADNRTTGLISAVLCELLKARSLFQAEGYSVRVFLPLKNATVTPEGLESYFPKSARSLSDNLDKLYPNKARFKWSVNWSEGEFDNEFEFDARGDEFDIGYARRCNAEKFPSFNEFLTAANIMGFLERIQRFLEPLIADR